MQSFGLRDFKARVARYRDAEHPRIDAEGLVVRLDVIAGTLLAGPVLLAFEIRDDPRLRAQLSTIRAFCELRLGKRAPSCSHQRLAASLLALHAFDARHAGASLRDICDMLLGPGDWPGDGEHRKSRVRRLVAMGEAMVRDGPGAILG